jgi:hypothetical protein
MSNYFIEKTLMASSDVKSLLKTVQLQAATTPILANQGLLVTLGDKVTDIYGNKDESCYAATVPAADTDPIHILDILEVPYATNANGDRIYRVGEELSNIVAPGKAD